MSFVFNKDNSDELLFANKHSIFGYNYNDEGEALRCIHNIKPDAIDAENLTSVQWNKT